MKEQQFEMVFDHDVKPSFDAEAYCKGLIAQTMADKLDREIMGPNRLEMPKQSCIIINLANMDRYHETP